MDFSGCVRIYGIRHHGPGSARRLSNALSRQAPDCLLVEGPPEGEKLWKPSVVKALEPPIAMLVYRTDDWGKASFYPFASFSPEWQALQYALSHSLPVRFIDLSAFAKGPSTTPPEKSRPFVRDPLGYLARLAGYEDGERWWEATFETWQHDTDIFDYITDLMKLLREQVGEVDDHTLAREAMMRSGIRKAIEEGFQNIAVVCGAWHAPALERWSVITASSDRKRTRPWKQVKAEVAWTPWSYERLSRHTGYGAGVVSPAWYELLFEYPEEVEVRWMSQAAALMREKGRAISTAHVLEATRLAHALTSLREQPAPGRDSLQEAALAVMGEGKRTVLDLIASQLIIGQKIGRLGPKVPSLPLQKDLVKQIRSARLTKYWEKAGEQIRELDVRKESNLKASQLLHRLNLLHIPWGTLQTPSARQRGSFKETWELRWQPELTLRVIEAAGWGLTVSQAATSRLQKKAETAQSIRVLAQLMQELLQADLPEAIPTLATNMQQLSAKPIEVTHLLEAVGPLVRAWRYGNSRQIEVTVIEDVLAVLLPRLFLGLPEACVGLSEEAAQDLLPNILEAHHTLLLLSETPYPDQWLECLERFIHLRQPTPLLHGAVTRLLFDRKILTPDQTRRNMSFFLSTGFSPLQSGYWIEGFLQQSALLLLHYPALWTLLDDWLQGLQEDRFERLLPILRRTFSDASRTERQKLLEMARSPATTKASERPSTTLPEDTLHFLEQARPVVDLLLGKTRS